MNNRRDFLKNLALTAAGVLAIDSMNAAPARKHYAIGLQLYTLRDTVGRDTLATLQKVSKAGYNAVEPYGYDGKFFGIEAQEFKKMCDDLNLKITATHTGITAGNAVLYAENALKAGMEYLVLPSAGERSVKTLDDYKNFAAELNAIGRIVTSVGLRFGYHNHAHEFGETEGQIPYDVMLSLTDPSLVCFEVDLFWMIKGGFDPLGYFKKYPGRFELWHVKDMNTSGESTIIGNGTINFKKIFSHAKQAGLKHYFVEQEQYDRDPADCAALSCQYLREHCK